MTQAEHDEEQVVIIQPTPGNGQSLEAMRIDLEQQGVTGFFNFEGEGSETEPTALATTDAFLFYGSNLSRLVQYGERHGFTVRVTPRRQNHPTP